MIRLPAFLSPARRIMASALPKSARLMARRFIAPQPIPDFVLEARNSINQIQSFEKVLNFQGRSLGQFSSILDFACGRGRLTKYLPQFAPKAQIHGCDIDAEAIDECRQLCPNGHFYSNDVVPPLEVPDGHFDFIFSYSVFTSLSESIHISWLKELANKLKPGGIMLHTIHSHEYLNRAEMFSPDSLTKYTFPEPIEDLVSSGTGYYYVPYSPKTPDYGLAIISEDYATTEWPKHTGLNLVNYIKGAIEAYPEGCQDIVILSKLKLGHRNIEKAN